MRKLVPPYFPIIYVRGYAMRQEDIANTVSTPYMGFNLGATKVRQDWTGKVIRHIFESPLVRLMKDYDYTDIYNAGTERSKNIEWRSIVIYRYYEEADKDLGSGRTPSIEEAAQGLNDLIETLRGQICGSAADLREQFRVYLVAHSMGGLICRCLLQNPGIGNEETKSRVAKVFTYATPHNGIEMAGVNVPRFLGIWDMNNFNRQKMAEFLALPEDSNRVDTLNGQFDPDRFFCLVGTNHKDYGAAGGVSKVLAGEMSDGLVRIQNATVQGAPRAFVYRSHSGPYGIVNSEEGYQNMAMFLFGDVRLDAVLEVESLPLPPSIERARSAGHKVRASYFFESTVAPNVTESFSFKLTERRQETFSAVLRKYDEMFMIANVEGLQTPRWPVMCSAFLNSSRLAKRKTLTVAIDLAVVSTGYEVIRKLAPDRHEAGETLIREEVAIKLTKGAGGWRIRYCPMSRKWKESRGKDVEEDEQGPFIPLSNTKGFKAKLRLFQTKPEHT